MSVKNDPRSIVIDNESYPQTLQNFPPLTGNTQVFISQCITNERVSELVNFPVGSIGDVQIKAVDGFGASSNFNYNQTTCTVNVNGNVATTALKTDNLLKSDGTPWTFSGQPVGSNSTVQFNNGGAFLGSDNFTWNNSSNLLTVTGVVNFQSSSSKLLGQVNTISILGGLSGQVLSTDGAGTLSWADGGSTKYDNIVSLTSASGVVVHDFSLGSVFNHTNIVSNFTANITNLNLGNNLGINVVLILNQGSTPYIPAAVQLGGVAQTINWQNNIVPVGNPLRKDLVSFSIINVSGTITVFGQLITFG